MICPVCKSQLHRRELVNVEIDSCSTCRGIWFDSGELGPVALAFSQRSGLREPKHQLRRSIVPAQDVDESPRDCPRCSLVLEKLNYAVDSNIILDRCRQCGGLWCDGPELDNLVSYVKGREDLRHMGRGVLRHTKEMQSLKELQTLGNTLRQPVSRFSWWVLPWIVPLGDYPATYGFPWTVAGLVVTNILAFLFQVSAVTDPQAFFDAFGLVPTRLLSGEGALTLVTSMFLHRGVWHLAGNMIFLWIFGDNVEESFGAVRFLFFYLGVGVLASLLHIAIYPASSIPGIGASGAIAGILGAYFVLHPRSRIRLFIFGYIAHFPAWFVLAAWFSLQLIHGLLSLRAELTGGTGWWVHISGFALGALLAYGWVRKHNRHGIEPGTC